MPSPLAEAFLMGILNGCYETPSKQRFDTCGIDNALTHRCQIFILVNPTPVHTAF